MLSDKMNTRTQLLGQGDNQVLINTYFPRPGTSIRDHHEQFMVALHQTLSSIGPPLKVEEFVIYSSPGDLTVTLEVRVVQLSTISCAQSFCETLVNH